MKRAVMGLFALAAAGSVAWACGGDWGYQNQWRPDAGVAMLTPANDTRINFVLLMADRYGTKVEDVSRLAEPFLPIEVQYATLVSRLSPAPPKQEEGAGGTEQAEPYGISTGSDYEWSSNNLRLCHSNQGGEAAFIAAVNDDRKLAASEKAVLIGARQSYGKACDQAGAIAVTADPVKSPAGKAYLAYVEGARLFYAEKFDDAARSFDTAAKAPSPWVSETAAYMRFRNALAASVKASAGEYGELVAPKDRDQAGISEADQLRQAYLAAYPEGRYAASAAGLARRIAWLRGDRVAMGAAYSAMVAVRPSDGLPDLITMDEIDRRILPASDNAGATDPLLLAIVDLMRLRKDQVWDPERSEVGARLTRAELEQQKPVFAREPELYTYLLAAEAYFSRNKPAEVLALIPDAAHRQRFSYLQFSRQMLRGLALEAVKDRNARAFWQTLLPGAVQPYQRGAIELAIYQHDRAAGVAGRLLETGSPILSPLVRARIIEIDATPDELRRTVKAGKSPYERDMALYMLLGNELRYGLYSAFLTDQLLLSGAPPKRSDNGSWSTDNYDPDYADWPALPPIDQFAVGAGATNACPALRATVTALAANAKAVRALLCLAEFIRRNSFDNWDERYVAETGKYQLNPRPAYGKVAITRAEVYRLVIDNPAASDDDKAFALNRALRCYQPSGINDCGGADVPMTTRKAWFQRLKTRYANTSWAKELKYYW